MQKVEPVRQAETKFRQFLHGATGQSRPEGKPKGTGGKLVPTLARRAAQRARGENPTDNRDLAFPAMLN
jgi:hypothetical protein